MQRLLINSRLSGGAVGVMITDKQDLTQPLNIDKVDKGDLRNLLVFNRTEILPSQELVEDPYSPHFNQPEYYMLLRAANNPTHTMIHHSHCLVMKGKELPEHLSIYNNRWGDSVLRKCLEDLMDVLTARAGAAALISKYNVDVIKTDGLKDAVTSELEAQVLKRLELFKFGMSNFSLGVLDTEEDLIRAGVSFGGLADVLNILLKFTAGAADIPMTRLFNEQSKSMGDTGAGDLNHYYDSISSEQEEVLRPILEQLDCVLLPSTLGKNYADCPFKFNPLYQDSENEIAQQRLANTQADVADIDAGIANVSQVQRRRMNDGIYDYVDADIKKLERYEQEQLAIQVGEVESDDEDDDFFRAASPNESELPKDEEDQEEAAEKRDQE